MKKTIQSYKILLLILLCFFSFFINYYYGNIGVFPIDTFAFFDTGYNILIDRHPFRDIWITSGFLVDYIQAAFFAIFGFISTAFKTDNEITLSPFPNSIPLIPLDDRPLNILNFLDINLIHFPSFVLKIMS